MAILNFPPTAGEPIDGSFTYSSDGVTYSWDGYKWTADTGSGGGGDANHSDGPTPPTTGELADQWYNTDDGRLYTYTADSSGTLVWIDASPDSIAGGSGGSGDGTTVTYNGASAWGDVADNGTLNKGLNIAAVTNPSTGQFAVVFTTPMSDSNYSVQVTGGVANIYVPLASKEATGFVYVTQDQNNVLANVEASFAVHSANAIAPQSGVGADAWGNIAPDGVAKNGFNIQSSARKETGLYEIFFSTPMPSNDYSVVATTSNSNRVASVDVADMKANSFKLQTKNITDGANNSGEFYFTVHASSTVTPTYTWTRDGTTLKPANDGDGVVINSEGGSGSGRPAGISLHPSNFIYVSRDSGPIFTGYQVGTNDANVSIDADGTATFSGGEVSIDKGAAGEGSGITVTNKAGGDYAYRVISGNNDQTATINSNGTAVFTAVNITSSTTDSNAAIARWKVGGNDIYYFRSDGSAQKPGGGPWAAISDARTKNSVTPYASGLAELNQIETVRYKYNGLDKEFVGVLAQQVENVMPELVSVNAGTTYDNEEITDLKSVDQTPLTFALINAVKELSARIETLEETNASLEARLTALEGGNN